MRSDSVEVQRYPADSPERSFLLWFSALQRLTRRATHGGSSPSLDVDAVVCGASGASVQRASTRPRRSRTSCAAVGPRPSTSASRPGTPHRTVGRSYSVVSMVSASSSAAAAGDWRTRSSRAVSSRRRVLSVVASRRRTCDLEFACDDAPWSRWSSSPSPSRVAATHTTSASSRRAEWTFRTCGVSRRVVPASGPRAHARCPDRRRGGGRGLRNARVAGHPGPGSVTSSGSRRRSRRPGVCPGSCERRAAERGRPSGCESGGRSGLRTSSAAPADGIWPASAPATSTSRAMDDCCGWAEAAPDNPAAQSVPIAVR